MPTALNQHHPVLLGESHTVVGHIEGVSEVPMDQTVETDIWFEGADGKPAVSAPKRSLQPGPSKAGSRGKTSTGD